jgi:Dolichyl-phosphate-mannose-protein mannosyltransferase
MPAVISIKSFFRKNNRIIFFGSWFLLNLIQARKTELFDDEAYYWAYSNYLDWGYFDHPPMIALMIKAGYFVFRNELGVRLFAVVFSTATLLIIRELLPKKNDLLFYAIVCSIAALQIGGILAVPDIPLLFFSALFFFQFRRFINQTTIFQGFVLGILMALMLYSKYHALLILCFTFLSHPKILTKFQTWIGLFTALLLFAPHLYWEYGHLFPSVRFQLVDRNGEKYDVINTLRYFPEKILFAGPLSGILLMWAAIRYIPKDHFEKALKWTMLGVYVFFLLSSLKGRVEANWTIPVLIPLIVLSHQYFLENSKARKWIFRLAPVTLLLVTITRIYMVSDVEPSTRIGKDEVHGNRDWVFTIQQKAKNLPVVFTDSYQYASKYWFYSGQPSFSLNTPFYHRNSYNFWPIENSILNRNVYVVGDQNRFLLKDSIIAGKGLEGGRRIDPYISFSGIEIRSENPIIAVDGFVKNNEIIVLVNDSLRKFTSQAPYDKLPIQIWIVSNDSLEKIISTGVTINQLTARENHFMVSFAADLPAGVYNARFAIPSAVPNAASVNSAVIRLKVMAAD